MVSYFRAVAVDYDGTLTRNRRPDEPTLASLRHLREASVRVILVTGRILSELVQVFPEVFEHFDAVVAENGCVLWQAEPDRESSARLIVGEVSQKLSDALRSRGVAFRHGMAILATSGVHDEVVRESCVALGLDDQLIRNRSELMVVPAGVSKATGLLQALGELGVSYHSTIGIGDAENDLALLDACELGVAVSNAVDSLKEHADVVLEPDGLQPFLETAVLSGLPGVERQRRRIALGTSEDGRTVSLPASRAHVYIDGPSGSGKSYIAGLFAEGLVAAGYSTCMLDAEGEHGALGHLRGVLTLGGRDPLPSPEQVARLIHHRFGSLVIDLSLREPALRQAYARDVVERLNDVRDECGLPHWIILEEAHVVPTNAILRARAHGNVCLVTYHPEWLGEKALRDSDYRVTVEAPHQACLRACGRDAVGVRFRPLDRAVAHVRHQRKYTDVCVPPERGFTFRDASGWLGPHVTSLTEFRAALESLPPAALAHHAAGRDLSRWVRDVFQDLDLARAIRTAEDAFNQSGPEAFRTLVQNLITLRHDFEATPSSARGDAPFCSE